MRICTPACCGTVWKWKCSYLKMIIQRNWTLTFYWPLLYIYTPHKIVHVATFTPKRPPPYIPAYTHALINSSASDYLQELTGFMVSSVNMMEIIISWTEVNSLCSGSISYNVASNCSSVTCTTRRKEATCSNLPIATICSFSISSSVCGQMESIAVNNAITVTLRRMLSYSRTLFLCHICVHDCVGPQANITPVYSPGSPSTLTKVIITIYPEVGVPLYMYMCICNTVLFAHTLQPFLSVARAGPSPVTSYSFSNSTNANVNVPACQDHEVMCQHSIDITCPPLAEIDVTLSASNMLGRGPATDSTTIGI